MGKASPGEIRAALAKLRNASTSDEVRAAKSEVTTLGGKTAMELRGSDRDQFVRSLDADIDEAYRDATGR